MSSGSTPAAESGAAPAAARRGPKAWHGLLGLAISIAFLAWTLRGTDPAEIGAALRQAHLPLFVLSAVTVTLTFPARAMRTRWLLRAATGAHPPWVPTWRATAIGFMANNVLPLRTGEIARGYATGALLGIPVPTALGAIAVERVFDGIVLMLLLAIGIAAPGFPSGVHIRGTSIGALAASTAAIFLGALVVLALVARFPGQFSAPMRRMFDRLLSARAAAWATRVMGNIVNSLAVLRQPRDFAWVVVWSLVVWGLNAASYVLAFHAFNLDAVPASAALVLQGIVALGVAVPSTPGFVGVFEALCVLVLGFYGVIRSPAFAFGAAIHLAWFVPITTLGLWSLARAGLHFRDIRSREAT